MRVHRRGLDVLGAETSPRAVLVRVRNAPELVRKAGAVASLAQSIFPSTLDTQVYVEMAKKLADGLKKEGVDAEVSVVEPAGWQPASRISWGSAALGAGAVGLGALLLNFFRSRR